MKRNLIISLIILTVISTRFNFAFAQPGPGSGFGMMRDWLDSWF